MMKQVGQHAIVIGASMGGLLAARALTDYYQQVTLLERDTFPALRRAHPQGVLRDRPDLRDLQRPSVGWRSRSVVLANAMRPTCCPSRR